MGSRRKTGWLIGALVAFLCVLLAVGLVKGRTGERIVAEGDLGDGRIFQVEKVSFGKEHEVGAGSAFVEHFGAWLPMKVREFLEPKVPKSKIEKDEATLVIWVTALDAITRTNVDCQAVRMELRDAEGNVYGDGQPHWFGAQRFWRVGACVQGVSAR